ncbi:MAG: tRNA (N6-threonylcarbamoyladenosine(37)-N6)-methyltransferase TrmO [Firmicutes bacterium]|nr:tRNA (N6-threonylcarbamoyladenosine(37)-N6)-methyltransferase TrmO [Bacillota bacterium]
MKYIGYIQNDFPEKFGLPRQSGLAPDLLSKVIMEESFRIPEAFRGIEAFSHLWLLWEFEPVGSPDESFSPTVRPPKLGGNERVGVFASRSPNRPNRIGMTLVKLICIETDPSLGPVLTVAGGDMKDGTRILDIKPYLPYADCVPDANGAFAAKLADHRIPVVWETPIPSSLDKEGKLALEEVLALDPRPGYQQDPARLYKMSYRKWTVTFRIDDWVHIVQMEEI